MPRSVAALLPLLAAAATLSADVTLPAASAQAYEQYVNTAASKNPPGTLFFDSRADRASVDSRLKAGEMIVDKIAITAKIPDASVHHYLVTTFVPGRTAQDLFHITSDFGRYSAYFAPSVKQSRVISRSPDEDRMFLQVFIKKATSVTLNTEHAVKTQRLDSGRRFFVRSHATRIAEIDGASEKQPGSDRGFLWKQDSFWTMVERDGGVYLQVEWISLARDNWVMRPFIAAGHREFMELLVRNSRAEALKSPSTAAVESGTR